MSGLLNLFAANILPIITIAGAGFVLQRSLKIDPRPLSQIIFYTFTPALIFSMVATTEIQSNDILQMAGFTTLIMVLIGFLSWFIGRVLNFDPTTSSTFILTATSMNAGNFGLSLNSFAFGEQGLAWASIFFITSSMIINSAGIYVATIGKLSPIKALIGLSKVPALYAISLAILVRLTQRELPLWVERPIGLLASAAVPSMLLLLGMQIAHSGLPKQKGLLLLVISLRLIVSPVLAWVLAPIIGLSGVRAQAGILETAMPTAVITTVIASEFDLDQDFTTGAVLATTLISPLTVTPLLAALGG